jgi:hypothetical protein
METSNIKLNEAQIMRELLVTLYSDCCNRVHFSKHLRFADLKYLERRIIKEGIEFPSVTLPSFSGWVLTLLENGKSTTYPSAFKRKRGTRVPAFLRGFTRNFVTDEGILTETRTSVEAVRCVLQICDMFSKFLSADATDAKKKKRTHDENCVKQFFDIEQECSAFNTASSAIVQKQLTLTKEVLDEIFYQENHFRLFSGCKGTSVSTIIDDLIDGNQMAPGNGPGSTFPSTLHYKRVTPLEGVEKMDQIFPHDSLYTDACSYSIGRLRHFYFARDVAVSSFDNPGSYVNKFWTVPKTSVKRRTIAVEHPAVVTYGKLLDGYLRNFIESDSPITSGQINFTDQSVNSGIVESGDLNFCTIDLSAASDRVAKRHIECFRDCWFYSYLRKCRSNAIEFTGDYLDIAKVANVKLHKFATMGNVLTFVIEALIFYATIAGAVKAALGCQVQDVAPYIYVYGDDIIVPREWYYIVEQALTNMGFKINSEKSYYKGAFRESCGSYAYKGENITPIRIKSLPSWKKDRKRELRPNISVVRFIDSAHYVAERGFNRCAHVMCSILKDFNIPIGHREAPILTLPSIPWKASYDIKELRLMNRERHFSFCEDLQSEMIAGFTVSDGNRKLPYPDLNWRSYHQLIWTIWTYGTFWQKVCVTCAFLAAIQQLRKHIEKQEETGFTDDLRLRTFWWGAEAPPRDVLGFQQPRIIDTLTGTAKVPVIKKVKVPLGSCSGHSLRRHDSQSFNYDSL